MVVFLIETFEPESIDDWRCAVASMICSVLPNPQFPFTHGRAVEFMGRRYLVFECILTSVIAALVFWGGRRPLARSVLVVERGDEDAPLTASIIADGKIIEVDATEVLDQLNGIGQLKPAE